MTVRHAYVPERHDPILIGLVTGWKLTDAEAAERMGFPVEIIRENRDRLGLAKSQPLFHRPPARPDALALVAEHLRGFNREAMTLNGRPIKLNDAMRLTNAELVRKGLPQVDYNAAWVVGP